MSTVEDRLREMWTAVIGGADPTTDQDFFAAGGTSIHAVHLAAGIQSGFGVAIDALDIVEKRTFRDIVMLIESRVQA